MSTEVFNEVSGYVTINPTGDPALDKVAFDLYQKRNGYWMSGFSFSSYPKIAKDYTDEQWTKLTNYSDDNTYRKVVASLKKKSKK